MTGSERAPSPEQHRYEVVIDGVRETFDDYETMLKELQKRREEQP